MLSKPVLVYTGGGHGGALPGIPARDLSAEEVVLYGGVRVLLKTGLYAHGEETKLAPGPSENQAADVPPETDDAPADEAAKEV